jgi:hypothetical protein
MRSNFAMLSTPYPHLFHFAHLKYEIFRVNILRVVEMREVVAEKYEIKNEV